MCANTLLLLLLLLLFSLSLSEELLWQRGLNYNNFQCEKKNNTYNWGLCKRVIVAISIALKWERVESMLSPLSLKSYGVGGGGGVSQFISFDNLVELNFKFKHSKWTGIDVITDQRKTVTFFVCLFTLHCSMVPLVITWRVISGRSYDSIAF